MDYSIKTQSKNPNIRGDPKKQKENLTLKVLKALGSLFGHCVLYGMLVFFFLNLNPCSHLKKKN